MKRNSAAVFLLTMKPGGGFTPASISGLSLWLDASDATTLFQASDGTTPATADNDVVGYWGDKSGNGRNAIQATTANKPLLKLAVQNGRNVVRWGGTDDYLLSNFGATLAQPNTIFCIANVSGGNNFVFDGLTAGTRSLVYRNATHMEMFSGGSIQLTGILGTSKTQYSLIYNGSSSSGRVNGSLVNSGDAGTQSLTGVVLGAQCSLAIGWLTGDICEMLVYNALLTGDEIARVEAYLNTKWAVY